MATLSPRNRYPSDVSDDEWEFIAPYLTLLAPDALQRKYDLREVFNAVRYLVKTGAPWRYLPTNFPPWPAVYQQARPWLEAGSSEALEHDLRLLLRVLQGRVLQSSPESGARASYNGHKRRRGSKVHAAVDTLGHLLALVVKPANADERARVAALAEQVQAVTGEHIEVVFVDHGYVGEEVATTAAAHGLHLEVVRLPGAKHGFVLLARRWVVERFFAWASRVRRLARDYERLPQLLAVLHFFVVACPMLHQLIHLYSSP